MSLAVYLAFIAACWVLAWTPGPAMSLIAANTITHGRRAGMMSVAGNTGGLAILVATAALGMSSLLALVADWFDVLRWVGALYLIFLGASRLYRMKRSSDLPAAAAKNARTWLLQGFAVALSNPKVLLFLGAFFPQFINLQESVATQLLVLSVTFTAVMGLADAASVMMIARARFMIADRWRLMDGISGSLLLAGGLALLAVRRP